MHFTFPALISPSLLKLTVPVAPSVHAAQGKFAALLGSFHAEQTPTQPLEVQKIKTTPKPPTPKKAKEEERNQLKTEEESMPAAILPIVTLAPPTQQEALPMTFALPAPVVVPTSTETVSISASDNLPEPAPTTTATAMATTTATATPTQPQPALPFMIAPSLPPLILFTPIPHPQSKPKAAAPTTEEPLTTLQIPLHETPLKTPKSEIAFEAKLTPSQSTPDSPPLSPTTPLPPPAPHEQFKEPDAPATHDIQKNSPLQTTATAAPNANPHPAAPHTTDPPAKAVAETTPVATPILHIEKSANLEPAPERSKPAIASTPDLPDVPAPRTEPARDISFRIASTPTDAVDVKLTDRAGQIHVAVRSSDPVLTQSLQSNVTDLASKLDKAGFQAETLIPNQIHPVQQLQQNANFQQSQQDRRAPQQEFQSRKKRALESTAIFTLNPQQEKQ